MLVGGKDSKDHLIRYYNLIITPWKELNNLQHYQISTRRHLSPEMLI